MAIQVAPLGAQVGMIRAGPVSRVDHSRQNICREVGGAGIILGPTMLHPILFTQLDAYYPDVAIHRMSQFIFA